MIIILTLILVGIMLGIIYYKKHIEPFKQTLQNIQQSQELTQIQEEPMINFSIMQHIGWLQNGEPFNNLNLYFNQTNATFCALPLNHGQYFRELIQLGGNIPKDGTTITINNKQYIVELEKNE